MRSDDAFANEIRKSREEAERIEQTNPLWIVVFGEYTRQFICFPRFHAPLGTVLIARYPGALPTRMAKVEQLCRIREGLRRQGAPRGKTQGGAAE